MTKTLACAWLALAIAMPGFAQDPVPPVETLEKAAGRNDPLLWSLGHGQYVRSPDRGTT